MIEQYDITLRPAPRGFHLITDQVLDQIGSLPQQGLLHLFILHTSAGLAINENADPTVRLDFEQAFNRLVPEDQPYYQHTLEGSDDMPAHIKSALVGSSLTVPIQRGRPRLGTWQGLYLCEFRNQGGARRLLATLYH
jgi:secondary thiamine-phosphate synthase enzyme